MPPSTGPSIGAAPPRRGALPSDADGSPGNAEAGLEPTILVVDDERNIRRTMALVLSGEGYRVAEAESAEQALTLLESGQTPVDLAIIDIMLPGMNGLDLLARLRQDDSTRELPVIVISGHATVHDAVQAIKAGAGDFSENPSTASGSSSASRTRSRRRSSPARSPRSTPRSRPATR